MASTTPAPTTSGADRLGRQLLAVVIVDRVQAVAQVALVLAHRRVDLVGMVVGRPDHGVRHLTIEVDVADETERNRVVKFLVRCVNVIKVVPLDKVDAHQREAVLVKVECRPQAREAVLEAAASVSADVVEVTPSTVTVFRADTPVRIRAMMNVFEPIGVREVSRSAVFGMTRGPRALSSKKLP